MIELLLLPFFFVLGLTIGGALSLAARRVDKWKQTRFTEEFNREMERIHKKYPEGYNRYG